MKIKPEHYEHMKAVMGEYLRKLAANRDTDMATLLSKYRRKIIDEGKAKDADKRVRWDVSYASGLSQWINDNLYGYLDDTHIDTALRRVMRELKGGEGTRMKGDAMRNAARLARTIVAEAELALPAGTERLPDNDQWTNRFEVKSETSDRVYTVAQNKKKGYWGCSCPAWRTRRKCKHLRALGLPEFEEPHQVTIASRRVAQERPERQPMPGWKGADDKCPNCGTMVPRCPTCGLGLSWGVESGKATASRRAASEGGVCKD